MKIIIVEEQEEVVVAVISNNRQEDPAQIVERMLLRQELSRALDEIGEREARVLRLRHGICSSNRPMTLKEVGRKIHLSRERVRQIEERALLRLRRVVNRMGLISVPEYRSV